MILTWWERFVVALGVLFGAWGYSLHGWWSVGILACGFLLGNWVLDALALRRKARTGEANR